MLMFPPLWWKLQHITCICVFTRTYSDMILRICLMSTFPLNSKVASNPFAIRKNSSESGTSSIVTGIETTVIYYNPIYKSSRLTEQS